MGYPIPAPVAEARAQFEAGTAAAFLGDREEAATLFLPLAEAGHMGAQAHLGSMYFTGSGFVRDAELAGLWLRAALRQGDRRVLYPLVLTELERVGRPL